MGEPANPRSVLPRLRLRLPAAPQSLASDRPHPAPDRHGGGLAGRGCRSPGTRAMDGELQHLSGECEATRRGCYIPCGADYACQNAWFTQYAMERYGSWYEAFEFWNKNICFIVFI